MLIYLFISTLWSLWNSKDDFN